jgi:hypothetical protein
MDKKVADPIVDCVNKCVKAHAGLKEAQILEKIANMLGVSVEDAKDQHPGSTPHGLRVQLCLLLCNPSYGSSSTPAKKPGKYDADLVLPKPPSNKRK